MERKALAEENREAVTNLLRLCNYMANDDNLAEELFQQLKQEHRTVQQVFMGIVKVVVDRYGAEEWANTYDQRNEAAYWWANKVRKISEENRYSAPEMRFPFL